jgi:hypothetical protein
MAMIPINNNNNNNNNKNNMLLLRWCLLLLFATLLCAADVTTAFAGQPVDRKNKVDKKLPTTTTTTTTTKQQITEEVRNGIGGDELEKYLYHDDPSAVPVLEYTDARKADFFATNKRRVVKFYSPFCVRFCTKWCRRQLQVNSATACHANVFVDIIFFYTLNTRHLSYKKSSKHNQHSLIINLSNRDIAACFVRNM